MHLLIANIPYYLALPIWHHKLASQVSLNGEPCWFVVEILFYNVISSY